MMNDAEKLELPHVIFSNETVIDEIDEDGYYDKGGNNISFRDWARLRAWDRRNNHAYTRIGADDVGDYWISTVWIGINHAWRPGAPPLIFETMVFNNATEESDLDMERYSTEQEAIEGHQRMVDKVRLIVAATK